MPAGEVVGRDAFEQAVFIQAGEIDRSIPEEELVVHRLCVGDRPQRFFVMICYAQLDFIVAVN